MGFLITLHSIWRWLLLLLALVAVIKAIAGWLGKAPYTQLDRQLGLYYTVALDIQVLLGLILWILERRWTGFQAMGEPVARFFALEHPLMMVVAVAIAHIGYRRSRGGTDATSQHRTAALFFLISLIIVLVAIPGGPMGG